jgi:serine/threonine protein kinase
MKRLKEVQIDQQTKGGTLTEDQGKFITVCLLEALRNVHGAGIVHRDIKPDNILIDCNGYPKLADFGIAESLENIVPGSQFGTLSYMAPEIIFEHSYGYTADFYSIGVLLLLMVTGDMLSTGKNIREAKKAVTLRRETITTKKFAKRYPYITEEC